MKHGLPGLALLFCVTLLSTGCVTERTYTGTDTPVSERKLDKVAAARERVQLGLTYLNRGNSEQAKYNLDRALEYAPELEDVHVALAYYYQTVGDLIRTEESYNRATSSKDASGDSMNNFGVFLCQQKQYDRAEKLFLAAIEMPKYTRTASSYENLGICSRDAGQVEKARHYFEIALKYDPRRQVSLLELAELELEQGELTAARAQMARYHAVTAQTPESLALAIHIEQALKDDAAARRFGILLLAKFPASLQAKQYRANLHQ
ncbi:type IV pilus biogenesis/stability protein PilW [Shewanella salipaludis]|uniref:Type IV pilus biogenesis/stability protein PilW n=1 Tax=Shewanella salipaludis TaxID=2723052 RepID=A0A972FUF3_9GAMM|nr:type IV pilus biogenesis/stability protein PilW [Shewanella salipaludis]NMH65494.1 type IV pilus biogenesis/stability protein PilW [Shewanella salipaludis]